ncbi:hypothetical protein, partial [Pseudomonas rustica]|uniref:hypothetical protein n=1 Tax=Pseudomonas rustica TaxID=2827099 RepID=UPI001BAE9054
LMLAGFERSRATEPIVGVFYIEGFHGCALLVLFGHTVIEAQPVSEGEATSCRERQLSANSGRPSKSYLRRSPELFGLMAALSYVAVFQRGRGFSNAAREVIGFLLRCHDVEPKFEVVHVRFQFLQLAWRIVYLDIARGQPILHRDLFQHDVVHRVAG